MLLLRLDDSTDPWGTGMGWFFGITHVIWHLSAEETPPHWEYRHGIGCTKLDTEDWPTGEIAALYESDEVTDDDLLYVGEVLHRYTAALAAAGKDY
jgi:hypothetical protein